MTGSPETIFERRFWLGQTDARPLALLRLALGLVVLVDLGERLVDFHAFYTSAGLAPEPLPLPMGLLRWSLFSFTSSASATLALYLAGFVLAAVYAAGLFTRLAGVLLWVFVISLHNRNPFVTDGGDAVLVVLLFWAMFADTGACLSLDVWLSRRPPQATVAAVGLRFVQLQVALVYLVTVLAKHGPAWRDGSAVLRAISVTDWGRGLAPALAQHPPLCAALSYATLLIEAAFPLLVFWPARTYTARAIALGSGLLLHLGIFLTMRVGMFPLIMPASYLAFVPAAWLDRLGWPRPAGAVAAQPGADGVTAAPSGPGRRHRILCVVLGLQLALVAVEQVARAVDGRLPDVVAAELMFVGQRQNWRMFAPDAPSHDVTWTAPGTLADGRSVELAQTLVPELGRRDGFRYSRWLRLRSSLPVAPPDLLRALGRYVCHRWNAERAPPPLASFELRAHRRPLIAGETTTEVLLRQRCSPASASPDEPNP